MSDDTKELKAADEQLAETRPLEVSGDVETAETTVLPASADAVDTTTLPVADDDIDETRPMTTSDNDAATTVIPNDKEFGEDAAEADGNEATIPLESVADTPIPSASDVPLYAAGEDSSQSGQAPTNAGTSSTAQPVGVQPQAAADLNPDRKRDISTPTVIFGLLGVLIGALGLIFGVTFPDMLVARFTADPQVLVAIICAIVGVVLVVVAIVWAVMGTVKKK